MRRIDIYANESESEEHKSSLSWKYLHTCGSEAVVSLLGLAPVFLFLPIYSKVLIFLSRFFFLLPFANMKSNSRYAPKKR